MSSKMIYSDFEYEKNYAAQIAHRRHGNWECYIKAHRVAERFKKPGQLTEIKRVYDRWNT